jgi:diamine N-acetyltransferase
MYVKVETENQIETLADLAEKIWRNHFGPVFEPKILEHLINIAQSKDVIAGQIKDGYLYYFIQNENVQIGYFAYKLDKPNKNLFLSKLYIIPDERKKGIGRQVINHLEEICKIHNISKITLTVLHKNLSAINAYEKIGFRKIGLIERVFDKDLICNDYEMEKSI